MSKKKKRYTEEEDALILKAIKEQNCIAKGCRQVADQLGGRSTETIVQHYYNVIVKKPTIIITDKIRVYKPRKPRDPNAKQISQITNVMRKLLKLSNKDREKILNFFK